MSVEERDDTKMSEEEGISLQTEKKAAGQVIESWKQCEEEIPPAKAEEDNLESVTQKEDAVGEMKVEKAVEESSKDKQGKGKETEGMKTKQEKDKIEGDEGTAEGESPEDDEKMNASVSLMTPSSTRPARERKTVERYSAPLHAGRSSGCKTLTIAKGSGTVLKDIPNVAYKLLKRKPDDNLQLLHIILFGKKAKAHNLKRDIGNFSGFVWAENEEKQKSKIKEKLDKCVKEKLLDFCDFLNIPVIKATSRKEDLSVRLFEFLQSPHATTEVLLADKNMKARKRKSKSALSRSANSKKAYAAARKASKMAEFGGKQKKTSIVEEESDQDNNEEHLDAKDECMEHNDEDHISMEESGTDNNSEEGHKTKEATSKNVDSKNEKESTDFMKSGAGKSLDILLKLASGESSSSKKEAASFEAPALHGKSPNREDKVDTRYPEQLGKQQFEKDSSKPYEGRGSVSKKYKKEPTREDLYAVIAQILNEVDFNTATLSDILRQLGCHFNLDIMHMKAEVKEIITEVINSMSESESEEEGD